MRISGLALALAWLLVVFLGAFSLAFANQQVGWDADDPWPPEYLWVECCSFSVMDEDDIIFSRSGGPAYGEGVRGKSSLSLPTTALVHEFIQNRILHNSVEILFIDDQQTYREWLTIMCVNSNDSWALSQVVPSLTVAAEPVNDENGDPGDLNDGISLDLWISWREEGGSWSALHDSQESIPFPPGIIHIVFLIEITVYELPLPSDQYVYEFSLNLVQVE